MTITLNQFSQSEITTHEACPRKWYFQYGKCIQPKGYWSWALTVGTELHKFLEHFHGGPTGEWRPFMQFVPKIGKDVIQDEAFQKKYNFWTIFFPAWCEAYYMSQGGKESLQILSTERLVEKTFQDVVFRGKIDMEVKDSVPHIWDNKTMANMEIYGNAIKQRFQFLFYFWLAGYSEGKFTINKIKKPALRQKQNEGDFEFANRCAMDVKDPARFADYFGAETAILTREDMERFESKIMLPKVAILRRLLASNPADSFLWTNMQLANCNNYNRPCEFRQLCFEDESLAEIYYEAKTNKHTELE